MAPKVDKKHKKERRFQILTAAFACFDKLGYQQTTMRDICKEADLSTGAVYSYFPSKKDIVYALAEYGEHKHREIIGFEQENPHPLEEVGEEVAQVFIQLDPDSSALEKIKGIMVGYLSMFDNEDILPSLRVDMHLKAAALQDEDIFGTVQESLMNRLQSMEELLVEAKSEKIINDDLDVKKTAQILLSLLAGSFTLKLFHPSMSMKSYSQEVDTWLETVLQNTKD